MRILRLLIGGIMAMPSFAQTPLLTQKAELAVPFGVVTGRLITVGDYLVFLDDEKPEFSLAVSKSQLQNLTAAEQTVTLETIKPVRDRSGEHSKLVFRLVDPAGLAAVGAWHKEGPPRPIQAASDRAPSDELISFQVKHDHRIGSCSGRLMLQKDRVVFESIDDIAHSRQWSLRDIKEMKRDNPYGIKIIPFAGETCNLGIQGKGMDSDTYRSLVDRVTAARVER